MWINVWTVLDAGGGYNAGYLSHLAPSAGVLQGYSSATSVVQSLCWLLYFLHVVLSYARYSLHLL